MFLSLSKWAEFQFGSGLDEAYQRFLGEAWCNDGADEYRVGDAAVDVAVEFVGFLFGGREGGDGGGVGGFDDGVEVVMDCVSA